ncbi:MAG: tripartite tricarboxylate transporter TctB family protein [Deltaproteobacteria bacterium]|nr:tripartite tricarboxylate transporter TctB family protein [Deltaproteobacteria bacterium]
MPKLRELRGPLLEITLWLALAITAFALTYQFNEPLPQYRFGATGWPRALISLLIIFAFFELFSRYHKMTYQVMGKSNKGIFPEIISADLLINIKRLATFLLPLIFLLLMPRMGYYVITPFFLAGYMFLLGERRLFNLVLTTFFIYLFTLAVFTKLLFVSLPVGNWPGFYEINNLMLSLIKGL